MISGSTSVILLMEGSFIFMRVIAVPSPLTCEASMSRMTDKMFPESSKTLNLIFCLVAVSTALKNPSHIYSNAFWVEELQYMRATVTPNKKIGYCCYPKEIVTICLTFICGAPPDRNFPFIQFPIRTLECIITDKVSSFMDKGYQNRVSCNDKLDGAFHSKVPNILFFGFEVLQILFVLLNDT